MSSGNSRGAKSSAKSKCDEDVELLLRRIDEQNEQIARLQTKFRDVTHAYKSLLAEKQALEITVKALKTKTLTQSLKPTNDASGGATSLSSSLSDVSSEMDSQFDSTAVKKVDEEASQEEKIAALTSNVQILLENKSKLEASYQAERKKFRSDYEELKLKLESLKQESQKQNETSEVKIKELKTALKQSYSERDNLTLELNGMIKIKQTDQDNKNLAVQEENLSLLANYRNENNELKFKIKNLTKQFENKCEELVQCENDYKKLKLNHDEEIRKDEQELINLRSQLKELSMSSEKRIGDLESNLAQLCTTIAAYENNNNTVNLLDPKSPSKLIGSQKNKNFDNDLNDLNLKGNDKMDLDSAIEQISQLKSYIESTARDLNINFNFNEIWLQTSEFNVKFEKEKQAQLEKEIEKYKEENRHLKEEYEKFKLRTNYLIKSAAKQQQLQQQTSSKEDATSELTRLKDEIETLKATCSRLKQEKEDELTLETDRNERMINEIRIEFKQKVEKLENERLKSLTELEHELKKQRERTVRLLDEKQSELEQLRESSVRRLTLKKSTSKQESIDDSVSLEDAAVANSDLNRQASSGIETPEILDSLVTNASLDDQPVSPTSNYLLYSQQLAYKDSELNKLRLSKNELEYKLKQIYDEHSVDIERLQSQIKLLKEELERLGLNESREQLNRENLEYIKNVVFNYMTTKDHNVKLTMINAIIQILKFTKNEKQKLQQILNVNKMV